MNFSTPTAKPFKAAEAASRMFSVRTKGLIVVGALIIYAVTLSVYAFHQKGLLRNQFDEVQKLLEIDSMLKEADVAAFYAMVGIIAHGGGADRNQAFMGVHAHYLALRDQHAQLAARMPQFSSSLAGSDAALEAASKDPSIANMNRLMTELEKVEQNYVGFSEQIAEARKQQAQRLRDKADSAAMTTLGFGMLGLAFLGVISGLFFKHLTVDLRTLQARALAIVKGYRGEPIRVSRNDEVGQLMSAVNSMASELDVRERELMLERQKYFHQEKMAAIGTLAAGVAHEIGNPIAAIAGIAQEMSERRASRGSACVPEQCWECRPDLIHAQTQRLAAITREISDLASPQLAEFQLLDLNAHLRSASKLIRYDKRLRRLELRLDLNSQLPAIYGIADQLTQLIMNLLINAMDAVEDVQDRFASITVSTRVEGDRVCMSVEDNGHGMEKDVLSRAFDPFFTTKPAGKGTGLGLALCYSIVQNHGGSIDIDSTPEVGTRVRVFFSNQTADSETRSL